MLFITSSFAEEYCNKCSEHEILPFDVPKSIDWFSSNVGPIQKNVFVYMLEIATNPGISVLNTTTT